MHLVDNDIKYKKTPQPSYALKAAALARLKNLSSSQPLVSRPSKPLRRTHSRKRPSQYLVRLKPLFTRIAIPLRLRSFTFIGFILVVIGISAIYLTSKPDYQLTSQAKLLLNTPDSKLSGEVSYSTKNQQFVVNSKGSETPTNSSQYKLVGQPSAGLYTATLPDNLIHGITVTNNSAHIGFTMALESKTSPIKHEAGHFVYPVQGSMQAVYTPQSDQLTEDIILNRTSSNSLTLKYHLSLPAGLHAEMSANGPEVVNSDGFVAFQFATPVIRESNSQPGGKLAPASARLVLTGNTLSLIASQLAHLKYPITIDPSILINSTNGFVTGNNEGDIAATTTQFNESGLDGGIIGSWTATTTFPTSAPVMLPRFGFTTVAYNGYMYVMGGEGSTGINDCTGGGNDYCNGVFYAPINSNGTIGSWTATTSFTTTSMPARVYLSAVTYNGYLYVTGGLAGASSGDCTATGDYCKGVFYALICTGSNNGIGGCGSTAGAIGSWTATTSFTTTSMPAREAFGAVAYNGYLYVMGGLASASSGDCISTGDVCKGVFYAPFNSDGTIGSWTATTTFATCTSCTMPGRYNLGAVAYNGYLYVLGGTAYSASSGDCTAGSQYLCNGAFYAPINGTGTIGSWVATTTFPTTNPLMPARSSFGVSAYNGYLYVTGGLASASSGDCTATAFACNGVFYAPINASGTIGDWSKSGVFSTTIPMPARSSFGSIVYNGYLYVMGGTNSVTSGDCSSTYCKGVFYAQILTAGNIDPNWYASANALSQETLMGVVAWNGYLYEAGGGWSGTETNTTEDAVINANGTLGSWTAQTTLVTAVDVAATVVYNGWIYVIGGCTTGGGCNANVQSAQINATTGALGTWANNTAVTVANGILDDVAAVAYNGYIYVMGGCDGNHGCGTEAVYYDSIGSTGTLGTWAAYANTATGSLQTGVIQAGAIVDDGYIYVTGGCSSTCPTTTVQYAKIDQTNGKLDIAGSGTCGAGNIWCTTSSLSAAAEETFSVAANGYIYMIAGYTTGGGNMATVQDAPINSNGTLGTWVTTSPLPYSLGLMGGAYWNGFIYLVGGNSGNDVLYTQVNNGGPGSVSAWTTSSNNLASPTALAATAVYNGYVYEIGGCANAACPSLTVYYASINSNGGIGAWQSTTSLGTATSQLSAVADNGYLYELGGLTGSGNSTAVYYASINSNGTINAWQPTTVLLNANSGSGTVVYNGYIYEVGGCNGTCPTTEVDYAPINANGTIGSWTATSSLLTAATFEGVAVDDGYIYSVGGCGSVGACGSSTTNMVEYAVINANGTLGSWSSTSSLYTGTGKIGAVVDDGYLYALAGVTSGGNSAVVGDAAINTNGSLGNWAYTTSVPNAVQEQTVMTYDGYVYQIGGVVSGTNTATTNYAALNSIPRVGGYSMLVNIGNGYNVTPSAIVVNGTNTGNPGNGGLAGLAGMTIQYHNGTTTCSTFSAPTTVDLGLIEVAAPYKMIFTADGCGNSTGVGEYAWLHFALDDSQTASFPDVNGNHTTVTSFQIFYHPASSSRLRDGLTLQNGVLGSLDTPPPPPQ